MPTPIAEAAGRLVTAPLVFCARALRVPCENPGFPATRARVRGECARMRGAPAALPRPVVVLGGYRAAPHMAQDLARRLRILTSRDPADFLAVSYTFGQDIDEISARVVERVERGFPSPHPGETAEVDVVGISMGGLVGRVAALPPGERPGVVPGMRVNPGKRLNVRRLFTLASPHRGAGLARLVAPDRAARAMRPGSAYLARLDAGSEGYEIIPYAVLRDSWVGATRAAPLGQRPIWTAGSLAFSHFAVSVNDAIVADVALRLRGEEPLGVARDDPPRD